MEDGMGCWANMVVGGGGRIHEQNLNLNMSLISDKIWNKLGEI
jgi:hypothetical protein